MKSAYASARKAASAAKLAKKEADAAKVTAEEKEAAANAKQAEADQAAAAAKALKEGVSASSTSNSSSTSYSSKAQNLNFSSSWLDNARKTKNSIAIVGEKEKGVIEGVAPRVRDYWDFFVSRLSENATDVQIKRHLQEHGIEVRDVFMLKSKQIFTKSAKVRVDRAHKDRVSQKHIWPKFIKVQDWVQQSKAAKKQNV